MLIARASYGVTDYCNASTQQYHQRSSLVEREVQAVNDGVKQAQEETYLHKGMSRSKYNDYTPEEKAQIGSTQSNMDLQGLYATNPHSSFTTAIMVPVRALTLNWSTLSLHSHTSTLYVCNCQLLLYHVISN